MRKDVFYTVSSNEAQKIQNVQCDCLKSDRDDFMSLFDPQVDKIIKFILLQLKALSIAHPHKKVASILVLIINAYNLIL